jgi:hypothetical protein
MYRKKRRRIVKKVSRFLLVQIAEYLKRKSLVKRRYGQESGWPGEVHMEDQQYF